MLAKRLKLTIGALRIVAELPDQSIALLNLPHEFSELSECARVSKTRPRDRCDLCLRCLAKRFRQPLLIKRFLLLL